VQRVLDNLAVSAVVFNVPQDLIASHLGVGTREPLTTRHRQRVQGRSRTSNFP
jgi:hypothetical protein